MLKHLFLSLSLFATAFSASDLYEKYPDKIKIVESTELSRDIRHTMDYIQNNDCSAHGGYPWYATDLDINYLVTLEDGKSIELRFHWRENKNRISPEPFSEKFLKRLETFKVEAGDEIQFFRPELTREEICRYSFIVGATLFRGGKKIGDFKPNALIQKD